MGYDIQITRDPYYKHWMPEERSPMITLDELYEIAKEYPELQVEIEDVPPDQYAVMTVLWKTDDPKRPFYIGEFFIYKDMLYSEDHSRIFQKLKWATRAELEKVIFLAGLLGAVVAGDHGEVYLPNGDVYGEVYKGPNDASEEGEYKFSYRWTDMFDEKGYQPSHYELPYMQ